MHIVEIVNNDNDSYCKLILRLLKYSSLTDIYICLLVVFLSCMTESGTWQFAEKDKRELEEKIINISFSSNFTWLHTTTEKATDYSNFNSCKISVDGYKYAKPQLDSARLNAGNEMKAEQKKYILFVALSTVALLLLLLSILIYAYRHRTKSNKILKNISRMRSNFFTNITHEFRTPLTVILGLSEQLQLHNDYTRDEVNYYLKAIDRQGNHLLRLVNQLLKMAKINAGMENPEWRRGNIVIYIQMVIDSIRLYAANKNVRINLNCSQHIIEMDFVPYYIDDIMYNLLSNAIKFSPDNSEIIITVATHNNKKVELRVADRGPGISKDELEHIFELFYQGAHADRSSDSGIGLSYTLQLIEIMNGKISVRSEINSGTEFVITLPTRQFEEWNLPLWTFPENDKGVATIHDTFLRRETNNYTAENKDFSCAKSNPEKFINVLLIEDNDDIILYLKTLFPDHYQVISAHNGTTGMKLAYELIPDIIISDIMMPQKDGFSLCREIRASELLNHIPVIFLTAKSSIDDQIKGMSLGADAFIRKPFHPDELLIQVNTLLENRRLLKDKYMRSLLKPEISPGKDINMDFLQKVTDIIYQEMHDHKFSSITLANKLNMSISQLNRKLSAVSGYSSSLYIMKLKIDRAKKKLAIENKNIGDIAAECGFYDVAYFSRTFKRHTQVTPSQYRNLPK